MFSAASLEAKADKLQQRTPLPELPKLDVPDGSGVAGAHRVIACVPVTFWRGKPSGAYADTMRGSAHRLEVKRIIEMGQFSKDETHVTSWLTRKLGAKATDTTQLTERTSLVMFVAPPPGTPNKAPWGKAYKAVREAIKWAHQAVTLYKSHQYALLIACDVTEWTSRTSDYGPIRETEITAVLGLALVKLERNDNLVPIATDLSDEDSDVAHLAED